MYEHGFTPDDDEAYPTLDVTKWRIADELLSDDDTDAYVSLDIIPDQYSDFNVVASPGTDNVVAEQTDYVSIWQRPREEWDTSNTGYTYSNPAETIPFVEEAPTIQQQLADPDFGTRHTIDYWRYPRSVRELRYEDKEPADVAERITVTEREALLQLDDFLANTQAELSEIDDPKMQFQARMASFMRKNLHYVDTETFKKAAAGIAGLWTSYLAENSKHQIYVPQSVIRVSDTLARKSCDRVFDAVHHNLDEDLQEQVISDPRQVRGNRWTKTVLLDDWAKSGSQFDSGYRRTASQRGGWHRLHSLTDNLEINLLIASEAQLAVAPILDSRVPTYAYYHGGKDMGNISSLSKYSGPHVTGSHSSVDLHYDDWIHDMVASLRELHPDQDIYLPPPCNIVRQ
jgi:hypothetical protein